VHSAEFYERIAQNEAGMQHISIFKNPITLYCKKAKIMQQMNILK
jgi:hypothetical protein